jgi:hypothetical protein
MGALAVWKEELLVLDAVVWKVSFVRYVSPGRKAESLLRFSRPGERSWK